MSTVKTLKVGQLVRVVSTVKDEQGKTLVSHGCKGHVSSVVGDGLAANYLIKFPSRSVTLTAFDVQTHIKGTKGRPRKMPVTLGE